jgi:hypothetical protein
MPIRLLIDNSDNQYLAEDAAILIEAFEGALRELGISDRTDSAAMVVANHIIAFAKAGERYPASLRELTVEAVRNAPRCDSGTPGGGRGGALPLSRRGGPLPPRK